MKTTAYPHELILAGNNVPLSVALRRFTEEKLKKLFRHQFRIVRARLHVSKVTEQKRAGFTVTGSLEIRGPDITATAFSDDCYHAIELIVKKFDNALRRRKDSAKARRKDRHPVEIRGAMIPKLA
jgi:ribosomal subunit interface protein